MKTSEAETRPDWYYRSIGGYQDNELLALTFLSGKEISKAIHLVYTDPDLKGLPWDSGGGIALFVPKEAVELLKSKGLKFTIDTLLNEEDLSPSEIREMRKKFGM